MFILMLHRDNLPTFEKFPITGEGNWGGGGASQFCSPHPKSLSQSGRGTLNPVPLLPFWEKGLGDEGKLAKLGCSRRRAQGNGPGKAQVRVGGGKADNGLLAFPQLPVIA